MKNILIIISILLLNSCKKDVIEPKEQSDIIEPIVKVDTTPIIKPIDFGSFNTINKTTSFYNVLVNGYQSYENFNNFRKFMPPAGEVAEHISSAYSYIDFDKDGDSDFIFASTSYSKDRKYVYIIQNNGNGNWSLFKKLNGCIWPRKGGLADFDNNGYLDFFIADQGYENSPTNYYTGAEIGIVYFYKDNAEIKYIPNSYAYNHTASAGDIDSDGDSDLVTIDNVYRNDGVGFIKEDNLTQQQQNGYYHCELMDLNNDGKLDLVAGNAENFVNKNGIRNYTRVFWNKGDGRFKYENATELPIADGLDTYGMVDDIDFIDFNNDGKLDIILNRSAGVPNSFGYYIQFLQNNGDNTFKEVTKERIDNYKLLTSNQFIWFVWIRLVDLNKDNKLDIMVREGATPGYSPDNEKELYWMNDGNNNFKLKQ